MNIKLTPKQALQFAKALSKAQHGAVVGVFTLGEDVRAAVYFLDEHGKMIPNNAEYFLEEIVVDNIPKV